ncbi:preprotein translocase subunit SecE [candidate division WOR-1 bacterium RIFOXYC2_FULL_37_10]|uniref:Protein translocase subunit SecE n=1 Tax=candidate division WOR-1 bacterium RIFOXYB2_FULL_37_13 TaxID=1802579 RepID=A0A1F4SRU5_UNCSA|nr:MAG: preprotein translocase subunit SecE [candidate division WOR-1 bacterium RIFOXYA2_FULL_37_7]OGC23164.1 MAG: preprotein translocase subunit SecE [candidate division WOR-1 bacterium RIFOXYB2_FULL_37_13]OGC35568.1 MAG: preprotein translocase subunit SecE [candidate division WOR-1 bacterium RIFOXYC2_FULL_37_10]
MAEQKKSLVNKIKTYVKETQAEAKKVAWPDRKYVISATSIIIVMVLVLSVILSVLDLGLTQMIISLTRMHS